LFEILPIFTAVNIGIPSGAGMLILCRQLRLQLQLQLQLQLHSFCLLQYLPAGLDDKIPCVQHPGYTHRPGVQ
jgi:hypothetical protein